MSRVGSQFRALIPSLLVAAVAAGQTIVTGPIDPQVRYTDGVRSLLVSQIGYASPGVLVAYLVAPTPGDGDVVTSFSVEDDLGSVVLTGVPTAAGTWVAMSFWRLDLSTLTTPGTYRVRAGSLASHRFSVSTPRGLWFDPLYAGMMLDQLRTRIRLDARGGFIDSGNDIRETNSHATQVVGMLDVIERYGGRFTVSELLEMDGFVRHFAEFLLAQQDASGRFFGGWFFSTMVTDGEWPNHLRAVVALVRLLEHYQAIDPTLTAQISAALVPALDYTRTTMNVATTHSVFLVDRLLADASHHLVTGDPSTLVDARMVAVELRLRQVMSADVTPGQLYGQFREQRGAASFIRLNHHAFGAMTGAYWGLPLWSLADLLRRYPLDGDAPMWRATLEDFVRGFLVPTAELSPFGLVANGEYSGIRWFSDLFHGMSMTYAIEAFALVRYGEALAWRHLYDVAEQQLLWIGGLNTGVGFPVGSQPFSCIVGHGYQWLRDGHGSFPDTPGSIVNGLSATPQFIQQMPTGPEQPVYLCDESWIAHTGGFLMAMSGLLRARLDAGNTLKATRSGASLLVSVDPVQDAQSYHLFSGDPRTLIFATFVADSVDPRMTTAMPFGDLVFLRASASDDAIDGPR